MSFVDVLERFAGKKPSSSEEVDEVLIALIQKHSADENKWSVVAKELGKIVQELKSKQWCKNRAKKSTVREGVSMFSYPSSGGVASNQIEQEETGAWQAKLGCFRIEPIEGKGLGVFATEDLRKGDLIIEEEPALAYTKTAELRMSSGVPTFIESEWDKLSHKKQGQIMELHDSSIHKSLAGIMRTNALRRGSASSDSVLCLTISRFNHSCSPNCQHAWDKAAHMERVFACTDIKAGEELCIYYIDVCKPKHERQRELHARYGFECACAACTIRDHASDNRREMMSKLDQNIMRIGMFNPKEGIALAEELLRTYDEEGINVLSLHARACYDAFQLSLALHDLRGAKVWIEKAHRYYAWGEGPENPSTLKILEYTRNPKSHRLWM